MELLFAVGAVGFVLFLLFRLGRAARPPTVIVPAPLLDPEADAPSAPPLPANTSAAIKTAGGDYDVEAVDDACEDAPDSTPPRRELSPSETAILEKHLAELRPGTDFDDIEAATRRCLSEILERAGRHDMLPLPGAPSRWTPRIRNQEPAIVSLWDIIEIRLRGKILESRALAFQLEEAARKRAVEAEATAFHEMCARQKPAIDTFLAIARRKLRMVDEYGDPDWRTLGPELLRFLLKVAAREGLSTRVVISDIVVNVLRDATDETGGIRVEALEALVPNTRWVLLSQHVLKTLRETPLPKEEQASDLSTLSGVEFETELAQLLVKLGFENVHGTPATGDQGADLVFEKAGKKHVAQAKRHSHPVGNAAVQQVIGARHFYEAQEAWVITNSTFTRSARELAAAANVRLIDGDELDAIREQVTKETPPAEG